MGGKKNLRTVEPQLSTTQVPLPNTYEASAQGQQQPASNIIIIICIVITLILYSNLQGSQLRSSPSPTTALSLRAKQHSQTKWQKSERNQAKHGRIQGIVYPRKPSDRLTFSRLERMSGAARWQSICSYSNMYRPLMGPTRCKWTCWQDKDPPGLYTNCYIAFYIFCLMLLSCGFTTGFFIKQIYTRWKCCSCSILRGRRCTLIASINSHQ